MECTNEKSSFCIAEIQLLLKAKLKAGTLLNGVGLHVRIDGFAGRMTSDAYFAISGEFLAGDKK